MWPMFLTAGVVLLVVLTLATIPLVLWLIWRNGYVNGWHASRSKPPVCPRCGYNLSGLTHCRCPECGTEYRLDQLWREFRVVTPVALHGDAK